MRFKTAAFTLLLASSCLAAWASPVQNPPASTTEVQTQATGAVTISSRGGDVRTVLFDLFQQGKKSFVLEPNVRFALYLHLESVEFDEALALILQMSNLRAEKQNGITFITRKPDTKPVLPSNQPVTPPVVKPEIKPVPKPQPMGKLTAADMQKRITTRFSMTDMRVVFAELSKQTGLIIEVAPNVPDYKVDAYLIDTSLKFGLDALCGPAGLKWRLSDSKSIIIEKKS